MKKIIFAILILTANLGYGQILQPHTNFGDKFYRLQADSSFSIPKDTFNLKALQKTLPHIAAKNESFYLWNTTLQKWAVITGSGGSTDTQYLRRDIDLNTINILNRLRIADTSAMLANYRAAINLKLNIADTANMLDAYKNAINLNTAQGIANAAAIQQRADTFRNNAGIFEARIGNVFKPQFPLPTGGDTSYANVVNYGAVGDGTTNNNTAFNAAVATGKNLYVPTGTFLISDNIILGVGQGIFGNGEKSIIKITGENYHIWLNRRGFADNLKFIGATKTDPTRLNQTAIFVFEKANVLITRCRFENIPGKGVYLYNTTAGGDGRAGVTVSDCFATNCNIAFFLSGDAGEYNRLVGCVTTFCNYGAIMAGGNNQIVACNFTDGTWGLQCNTSANVGHTTVVNLKANHNLYNLEINGAQFSLNFTGCDFQVGAINFHNTADIMFTGCNFYAETMAVDNSPRIYFNSSNKRFNTVFTVTGTGSYFENGINNVYNSTFTPYAAGGGGGTTYTGTAPVIVTGSVISVDTTTSTGLVSKDRLTNSLLNYVTTNTAQTISGDKTFTGAILSKSSNYLFRIENSAFSRPAGASGDGFEMFINGGAGKIQGYNPTTGQYIPVVFEAATTTFYGGVYSQGGVSIGKITPPNAQLDVNTDAIIGTTLKVGSLATGLTAPTTTGTTKMVITDANGLQSTLPLPTIEDTYTVILDDGVGAETELNVYTLVNGESIKIEARYLITSFTGDYALSEKLYRTILRKTDGTYVYSTQVSLEPKQELGTLVGATPSVRIGANAFGSNSVFVTGSAVSNYKVKIFIKTTRNAVF